LYTKGFVAEKKSKVKPSAFVLVLRLTGGAMTLFNAFMRLEPVLLIVMEWEYLCTHAILIVHYTGRGLFSKR
jgi:hypothetical protein